MSRIQALLTLLGFTALAALTAAADLADDKPAPKPEAPANDKAFHETLTGIAQQYKKLGPVDFEARWAPGLCDVPRPGVHYKAVQPRFSESKDADSHGRKLYYLFARDRHAYLALGKDKAKGASPETRLWDSRREAFPGPEALPKDLQAIRQFLVKESWVPEEIPAKERKPLARMEWVDQHVVKGDKTYKTGKQGELFIMVKFAAKTPGTDEGWVYGTLTPDTQTVTSSGKVESCMSCHTKATHDRQFGLAPSQTAQTEKIAK